MAGPLQRIKEKQAEAAYLRRVLELWDACPYPPEEVKAFTWRPEFLTEREHKRTFHRYGPVGFSKTTFDFSPSMSHNCVRMKDGTLKPIPLTRRP